MNKQNNNNYGCNDNWANAYYYSNDYSHCCMNCPPGPRDPRGYPGPRGPTGETGPAGNAAALTITPLAGGTHPDSAHLVITQIQ